jgi:hypothetical protein
MVVGAEQAASPWTLLTVRGCGQPFDQIPGVEIPDRTIEGNEA